MQPGADYVLTGPLRWCELDGDWVVYSTATGALRYADKSTAAVLASLEEGVSSAAAIAQRIAALTETDLSEGVELGIGELLDELQRTGFVECRTR